MKHAACAFLTLILLTCTQCALAREPIIGGPCEGCELVFEYMPDSLESQARIAPDDARGEALTIAGVVTKSDGAVAAGVIVYAYQTDDGGIYPKGTTRHGRLRGWVLTDEAGRYRFDTIRPGAYPGRSTPQHIHMHVIEPGRSTYYIDDIIFADDPLLTPRHREGMQRGRGGMGLAEPAKDEHGVWQIRRDITLGANIPGYE